jgi:hypothetical protein
MQRSDFRSDNAFRAFRSGGPLADFRPLPLPFCDSGEDVPTELPPAPAQPSNALPHPTSPRSRRRNQRRKKFLFGWW